MNPRDVQLEASSYVKTQEYNQGVSFRIPSMGFTALCCAIEAVPGVDFTKREAFFLSAADVGAEFSFRGHVFTISTDDWDGALWIMTKGGRRLPNEMQVLRDAVEHTGEERGFLANVWRRLMTETFT